MRRWIRQGAVVATLLGLAVPIGAQTPAPAVPAVPAVPPQASGIVGLVQLISAKCKACKAKCCACPLGQLLSNAMKPLNTFTGGILCTTCCPPVNPQDLKKSSTSAQGACAQIMQSEMEAKARRDAVRCLSRVDCHWWPEAEAALISSLRTDKNECVRLEAAMALGNGCCCTKKTIEALTISVSGSSKDGNPTENSPRVKEQALKALNHCLASFTETPPTPERPEKPPQKAPTAAVEGAPVQLLAYYDTDLERTSFAQVVESARRAVTQNATAVAVATTVPTGQRNLMSLWINAVDNEGAHRNTEVPPAAREDGLRLRPIPTDTLSRGRDGGDLLLQPVPGGMMENR